VVSEVDFNPEFISRMIPKLEWTALVQAAQQVSQPWEEGSGVYRKEADLNWLIPQKYVQNSCPRFLVELAHYFLVKVVKGLTTVFFTPYNMLRLVIIYYACSYMFPSLSHTANALPLPNMTLDRCSPRLGILHEII